VARTEPVLVDSNVLLDLAERDSQWFGWSATAIRRFADKGLLVINPIIYAEISIGFEQPEAVDAAVPADIYRREQLPYEAAFLAGKAFRDYRRRGGTRTSPLPDFYVGAHATVRRYRLLTRDAPRYRSYFPTVELIAP
jgi:predicted nucleic acid-binding protein